MKRTNAFRTYVIAIFCLIAILISGCSNETSGDIAGPGMSADGTEYKVKPEKPRGGENGNNYPFYGEMTAMYKPASDSYLGAQMIMGQGSQMFLQNHAMTAPDSLHGQNVVITMQADFDEANNELLFTFGPHGCQFSPPVVIYLSYADMGDLLPVLYYIDENGNYVEQEPEDVNLDQKWVKIVLHHFSRYALAHG